MAISRRYMSTSNADLWRQIQRTNKRIDNLLLLALVSMGGVLVVAVIALVIVLMWAILQAG